MEIIHTCLETADADRTADWYVEQLGFERTWEFTADDGSSRNVYVADPSGVELQLREKPDVTPSEQGDLWDHVALGVEDVDAEFERIDNHGVVVEPMDMPAAGARVAFVKDPDGHSVELVQPLED